MFEVAQIMVFTGENNKLNNWLAEFAPPPSPNAWENSQIFKPLEKAK